MITIGDEGTKRFVNAKDVDFGEDFEYDEWEMMKEAVSAIPEYDKTVKPESDEFLKENFENTGVYSIVNINKVNKS